MNNNLILFEEKARRATFKTWVFMNAQECNGDKMAEAGFIFTGSSREPDSAQCFYCDKSLDGWEAEDKPWAEHLKHASYCDFAKMQKPQDRWTLMEWLNLREKYEKKLIIKQGEEAKKQIRKMFDAARQDIINKK